MAIIQISKIQQRSGKLIDLPQLSDAEFGWATDSKRLFIGKSYPNENIEVLTSYSNISFSQIDGSGGNNLSILNPESGQILGFDGTNWVNKGGNAAGEITLGDVSNVKVTGGAIGYTLETDGTGNLSWTPKSTIIAYISNATKTSPVVITTDDTNFFTEALNVTITGVIGMTQLNGNSYYANVLTSNSFSLYSDPGLTAPINGAAFGVFPKTTATATTIVTNRIAVASTTGFTVNDPVVFSGTVLGGLVSGATYYITSIPTVGTPGNVIVSETIGGVSPPLITTSGSWDMHVGGGRVISTIGGGGASRAGGANTTVQYNNNNLLAGDADFTYNVTTKVLAVSNTVTATLLTGTSTTNAQPNITSVGLLTGLVVGNVTANSTFGNGIFTTTGNANIGNIGTGGQVIATGNITGSNMFASGTANVTGNVNSGNVNSKFFGPLNGTVGATTANTGAFTSITATLTIAATGNLSGANISTAGVLSVTGNANVGNLGTAGLIVATGNANAANFNTTGLVLASGNITGANLNTTGVVAATGNITGANLITGGILSVTGNANVGNLGTGGLIVATGNITGANLITGGILSVTGNANVGNLGTAGLIIASGNANAANFNTPGLVLATGNITGANLITGGTLSATGNANVGNLGTGGLIVATGNITGGNILTAGRVTAGGNVLAGSANNTDATRYVEVINQDPGTAAKASLWSSALGASVSLDAVGTGYYTGTGYTAGSSVVNSASTNGLIIWDASTTAQIRFNLGASIVPVATLNSTGLTLTGNVVGNVGNFATVYSPILTTGSNTTVGNITGNWTLTAGSKLTATYADLAEFYVADASYAPGTVLEFGGTNEVTLASDGTSRIAGVVSTNPAYVMNAGCAGEYVAAVALQGRVPCKVRGNISKGDMLISAGDGFARPASSPLMGTVIGKALANFSGEGVIEVAIGRL